MKIEWRSYRDLAGLCRSSLDRVRALSPDVIVGVPRSGMMPASILATALALPLADLHSFCARRSWGISDRDDAPCTAKRALLVDDASGFGRAMSRAVDMVRRSRPDVALLPCAAYADPEAAPRFALAMEVCPKPRLFEWNWWRSGKLVHCCVDIDGVVCPDPTSEHKRSPESYRRFVETAPLLRRPAKPVGAFVTGRSDAVRLETERWMAANSITYGSLAMFDGQSPRNLQAHAEHKARHYRGSSAALFIESDDRQAALIADMTRKPVVCVQTGNRH